MRPVFAPLVLLMATGACGEPEPDPARRVAGGDPGIGRGLVAAHDCAACHRIPGLRGPTGTVGPTLAAFARRGYIAGAIPNRPENLVLWLRDPPRMAPATAMPDLGLGAAEARHIAAYLYTLR